LDCGIAQVGQQLGKQEGVSARYGLAGIDEPIFYRPQLRGDHRVYRSVSEWAGADLHGLRLAGQQLQQLLLFGLLRPCGHQKRELQSIQTPREVGQEAQRRKIAPLCVVYCDQRRRRTA
jgi:hypothetical protein